MSDLALAQALKQVRRDDLAILANDGSVMPSTLFRRIVEECTPEVVYRLATIDSNGRWANYLLHYGGDLLEAWWPEVLAWYVLKHGGQPQLDYLHCFNRRLLAPEVQEEVRRAAGG